MRRIRLPFPAPPAPRSVWSVRTVEHRAALLAVGDALDALTSTLLDGSAADSLTVESLAQCIDAASAYATRGGGTPCTVPEDETRRLLLRCDLAKRILGQLVAMSRAPHADRALWIGRVLDTLTESAAG
jgi:hypothetical protein